MKYAEYMRDRVYPEARGDVYGKITLNTLRMIKYFYVYPVSHRNKKNALTSNNANPGTTLTSAIVVISFSYYL